MCGIFGSFTIDGPSPSARTSDRCTDTLGHRGPDDRGTYSDERLFLGMRRLSILDLETGAQPILDPSNRFCIVYNGELYNYVELRDQLLADGGSFRTRSDTEVVLASFIRWSHDCLLRFNGMFAFAIWDRVNRELFLARDRVGEKPLYYYWDHRRFLFASEIKAIVADPSIDRCLDQQGLFRFLSFGSSSAPRTIFRDIYKLPPGHYLRVSEKGCSVHRYWDISSDVSPNRETEVYNRERIQDLLADSVRMRMVSDVPLGAFLSGGIDSSAVVAYMTRFADRPVKTFSLGFPSHPGFNELDDARLVARHFGTEHHELRIDHYSLPEIYEKLAYHYDEPFGDAAKLPVYLLSRFARQHVKVVLGGEGADELFGGYRRYAADQLAMVCGRLHLSPRLLEKLLGGIPRLRRTRTALRALAIARAPRRYAHWLLAFWPDLLQKVVDPDLAQALEQFDPFAEYETLYSRLGPGAGHLTRLLYLDLKSWLPNTYLEKTDKASMAASLEVRLPFLDHRLVEFSYEIPESQKVRLWHTKVALKKALRDVLPQRVLRKRKQGFSVPTDHWFRGELKDYLCDTLTSTQAKQRGLFDPRIVDSMLQEHISGQRNWNTQLDLLLNFELWALQFLDGRSSTWAPETDIPAEVISVGNGATSSRAED